MLTRSQRPRAYDRLVPVFICPNCRQRSVDLDGREGFSTQAPQCRSCGFGFLFQLLEDYYPAPSTGFVVCDQSARVIAAGRGVFELTGFREADLIGRDVTSAFSLSDSSPLELVREWGVRRLGETARAPDPRRDREGGRRRPVPRLRRRRRDARRALRGGLDTRRVSEQRRLAGQARRDRHGAATCCTRR